MSKRTGGGNPSGRPKTPATIDARQIIHDVKEAAKSLTPKAIATLEEGHGRPEGAAGGPRRGSDGYLGSRMGSADAVDRGASRAHVRAHDPHGDRAGRAADLARRATR